MDKSSFIDFRLSEVSLELDILEDHLKHIKEQMVRGTESAKRELEATIKKFQDESDIACQHYEVYVDFRLPHILYNPFLVALYTVYESAVTEIACLVQKKKGQEISLNCERGGDFLSRAKRYYQRRLGYELSQNGQAWKRLKILLDLRNAIAHANGRFEMIDKTRRERLQKYIEEGIGIKCHGIGYLVVDDAFLKETFQLVKSDLKNLVERYKKFDNARRHGQHGANTDDE